ncbi:hypothetical protein [Burkholderia pseudomallei]|uniref:hypothetical protein n=1 Tax=Burkholderia pseudomallei TaxID=28450 RepID=UPI000A495F20|nr:hypothetical protein [Burkholderia pseudomallei]
MPDLQEEIHKALVESGANVFRARVIAKFVSQCYELLMQAHHDLVEPARWKKFCRKKGATTQEKESSTSPTRNIAETAISADLSYEANRLLAVPVLGTSPFVLKTDILATQADVTTPSEFSTGRRSKRPDIIFLPASLETKLTFALEAKVIRKVIHITNDLLGEAGFGCFIRADDPYESNGVIGLLGYVEKASVDSMTSQALNDIQNHASFEGAGVDDFELAYSTNKHQSRLILSRVIGQQSMVCVTSMLGMDLVTAWPVLPD